jgi:bacillopeptidase F
MDTGVDITHPALEGKWLSPYWYDAVNNQPNPYDDNGHGTYTMGIILGGDGFGPFEKDIGVAPGAKFVACKIFNADGSGYSSWIHSGFQKILEWKSQGVPIVAVSNSWGSIVTTSTEFWQDCLNWKNAGIIPVFAIGGGGPTPGSANTPANFPIVIGVGSTDQNDNIASFSARGPAPNQSPWNNTQYWPRPDWNLTKPDISAPGVNVYSSIPGGGYASWNGTSMACPSCCWCNCNPLSKKSKFNIYRCIQFIT